MTHRDRRPSGAPRPLGRRRSGLAAAIRSAAGCQIAAGGQPKTVNAGDARTRGRTYRRRHVRINRRGGDMIFFIRSGAQNQGHLPDRAFDAWYDAELLVQLRWDSFLEADRSSRPGAFAAYLAALDAEATAAGELAHAGADLAEAA